jgi:hypothetical protein
MILRLCLSFTPKRFRIRRTAEVASKKVSKLCTKAVAKSNLTDFSEPKIQT